MKLFYIYFANLFYEFYIRIFIFESREVYLTRMFILHMLYLFNISTFFLNFKFLIIIS